MKVCEVIFLNCTGMLLLPRRGQIYPSGDGVRTQVKIEKDGFELCPDTSQN